MSRVYMLSDVHLGAPNHAESLVREKKLVAWLNEKAKTADEIYIIGDLFDFWFEWKHVVPRGYVRLLGKLAELTDNGLPITVLTGNHDVWYYNYFPTELNIPVFLDPIRRNFYGKEYFIAHGDGLGPGDHGYKALKDVLRNKFLQKCFGSLHPNFAIWLANQASNTSRNAQERRHKIKDYGEKEMQVQFAKQYIQANPEVDGLIMGHRHLSRQYAVNAKSTLYVLGDWIEDFSYIAIGPEGAALQDYK